MKKLLAFLGGDVKDFNVGFLFLRVFAGIAMMTHGIPKIIAGPGLWRGLGGVMARMGVPGPAVFWGFMASLAESAGALGMALGLLTRLSAGLLAITMAVAAFVAHAKDPFEAREKALLYLFIALLYAFRGPGRISADRLIRGG